MDEQQQAPDAPVAAPSTEAPVDAVEAPAEAAPAYDWRRALDEAPAEEIRRHPKLAGIVGTEKQRWQADYEAQNNERLAAEAREKAAADLRELAQRNPVEFADKWLSSEEARAQKERMDALEHNARQDVGKSIGAGFHALPEWRDVVNDPDSLARLATAMQGKTGDEVLAAWNATAVEIVAARRAEALAEQRLSDRLKAERTAWETEAAAQGFVRSDRPDLVRGGRIGSADPEPDYAANPREWNAWYRRNTTGAA